MAFESQLAAQREQSKQRVIIKRTVFMLRIAERQRGKKKETILDVRLPIEVLKKAKLADKAVDIFFDHECHKCMIAASLAGVKLTIKPEAYGSQQFLFTKGFTPDLGYGGLVVNEYEIIERGDGLGIVFDYPALAMISGRNEIAEGETPTRPQTFALTILAKERERAATAQAEVGDRQADRAQEREAALPLSTIKFQPREKNGHEGRLPRRSFTDDEKREGVRAHLRWMMQGRNFTEACDAVGVSDSVMRKWRTDFLKSVERQERRLGHATHGTKHGLNGAHARAH